MLIGIYLGQFCITTLTYFFITWFPIYLVQARHMSICVEDSRSPSRVLRIDRRSVGRCVLGRPSAPWISLTFARKAPIVAGMLLSITMIACNFTNAQTIMMLLMSVAFFGKGFGALGWTVIADASPKELIGLNGGIFNLFGNIAGITTPIIIGYVGEEDRIFQPALIFVARPHYWQSSATSSSSARLSVSRFTGHSCREPSEIDMTAKSLRRQRRPS